MVLSPRVSLPSMSLKHPENLTQATNPHSALRRSFNVGSMVSLYRERSKEQFFVASLFPIN